MLFICYLLKPASGGTYIGVTGLALRKRMMQHLRERFQGDIDVEILATRETREEINQVEAVFVAELQPTLNRIKGGTSTSGYVRRKGTDTSIFCRQGHWREESYRRANGDMVCRGCRRSKKHQYRLAKRDDYQ